MYHSLVEILYEKVQQYLQISHLQLCYFELWHDTFQICLFLLCFLTCLAAQAELRVISCTGRESMYQSLVEILYEEVKQYLQISHLQLYYFKLWHNTFQICLFL